MKTPKRRPRSLAVHVCSRDGPERATVLLDDLAVVARGLSLTVTLYDDSTAPVYRQRYRETCSAAALPVRYFAEADRASLLAGARQGFGLATEVLETSRPFGSGRWDLAGCRFTAMLNGATHPDPSVLHLFLDDDLRMVDCRYAGCSYVVDSAAIRRFLADPGIPVQRLFAAGVGLRGRTDLATLEHIDACLARPGGSHESSIAGDVPASITPHHADHRDSPGISGGFLLTNRVSLRTLPLPHSYNEDWLWLRQLAMAGGTIQRSDSSVVHAGESTVRISLPALLYQFRGEVLDTAVRLGAGAGMPFEACGERVPEAFGVCIGRLDLTLARASAAGTTRLTRLLSRLRAQAEETSVEFLAGLLARHAESSRRWARAFGTEYPSCAVTGTGRAGQSSTV